MQGKFIENVIALLRILKFYRHFFITVNFLKKVENARF